LQVPQTVREVLLSHLSDGVQEGHWHVCANDRRRLHKAFFCQ
jgi:hypothetical protein